jgi:hypothetical protein
MGATFEPRDKVQSGGIVPQEFAWNAFLGGNLLEILSYASFISRRVSSVDPDYIREVLSGARRKAGILRTRHNLRDAWLQGGARKHENNRETADPHGGYCTGFSGLFQTAP